MITSEAVVNCAAEIDSSLSNIAELKTKIAHAHLSAITSEAAKKFSLRSFLEVRVFARQISACLYPRFESYLIGNIPNDILERIASAPKISISDASSSLLRELCQKIESFDENVEIQDAVSKIISLTTPEFPPPETPFNDDAPNM